MNVGANIKHVAQRVTVLRGEFLLTNWIERMKIIVSSERNGVPTLSIPYSGRLSGAPNPVLIVKRVGSPRYASVLVVIDKINPTASALIGEARTLAPDAKLILLYVFQSSLEDRLRHVDASEEKLSKVRMQRHEEALDAMSVLLYTAGLDRSKVITVAENGDLATVALKFASELHVDLTVIGTRSTSALRRLFFRNPVTEIVENAACDVLTVPVEIMGAPHELEQ